MITAENITDEMIREMRRQHQRVIDQCDEALRKNGFQHKARARCAAILNERAERAKESK